MSFIKRFLNEIVNAIFIITVAIIIFLILRQYVFQPFQVEGTSMEPQLYNGDQMIMLRQGEPERFDVIVFPDPRGSGDSYVKRIIGLPGDYVEAQDDTLYINGVAYEEPYLEPLKSQYEGNYTEDFNLWNDLGIEEIPPGHFFVLGDHRPFSGDSRQFGLIAAEDVQGLTGFIYYPFNRFGKIDEYDWNADQSQIIQVN